MRRWVATFLVWSLLGIGGGLAAAVLGPIPFGGRPLVVLSGSMAPALRTGDEILVRSIAPTALRVGDVVNFRDPSRGQRLVTHRVRAVRAEGDTVHVETRGDANDASERWSVSARGRVGRVMYRIPKLGYLTALAATPPFPLLLVIVGAIGLAAVEIWRVWRPRPAQV